MIKVYAITQKWTDQGISPDLYVNLTGDETVSTTDMIRDYLDMVKYNLKSRYYVVSRISAGVSLEATESAITTEQEICESCSL
jgi:ribonucleoside-diphosphate reductase alpha chain